MTHPTIKILEQGGVADGEAFKTMLEEETKNDVIETLKKINRHFEDNNIGLYSDSEKNKTLYNTEIFIDNILILELCKMMNTLYLDCKNEYGYFNKELFEKLSKNFYKKISTFYEELVDIYKKL
uniref:hypothetical protein n=1 Tax=Thomasclavelia spiroformis TaxID=29348 RepID=UPI00359C5403